MIIIYYGFVCCVVIFIIGGGIDSRWCCVDCVFAQHHCFWLIQCSDLFTLIDCNNNKLLYHQLYISLVVARITI